VKTEKKLKAGNSVASIYSGGAMVSFGANARGVLMFVTFKKKFKDAFLGELLHDWGTVFSSEGFFRESIDLSLRREEKHLVLWLTYLYTSSISYNKFSFGIPVWDLQHFTETLNRRYERLHEMSMSQRYGTTSRRDKLPFFHGLLCRAIHGVKASRLLIDNKNPVSGNTEYRLFGYITRKSEIKILIQSDSDIANNNAHIISGEGLRACISLLLEDLRQHSLYKDGKSGSGYDI